MFRTIMHAIQLKVCGPREGEILCQNVGPLLSEFIDEEVDVQTMEKIKAHLHICAPCRKFMESLEKTARMIGKDTPQEIPEDAAKEMMKKLRAEYQHAREELGGPRDQ